MKFEPFPHVFSRVFLIEGHKRMDVSLADGQNLSGNSVSKVWREGKWVYKQQPKFLTDNEIWCYQQMRGSGYVPYAEQLEPELIRVYYMKREPITDPVKFALACGKFLRVLVELGIRHGDLTDAHVIPWNSWPYVIDWAESRLDCDPRPDKRPHGDVYWMNKTVEKLTNGVP